MPRLTRPRSTPCPPRRFTTTASAQAWTLTAPGLARCHQGRHACRDLGHRCLWAGTRCHGQHRRRGRHPTGPSAHHTDYDQGAPNRGNGTGINPETLEPWRLPTTVTTGAASSFGAPEDPDVNVYSVTINSYAKVSSADATEGDPLEAGIPDQGHHGGIASTTRFNTEGPTTSGRQPSTGTDAGTTNTVFYTAGTNPADSACGNKVEWAGLTCWTGPAAAPTTGAAGEPRPSRQPHHQVQPVAVAPTRGGNLRAATRTTETRYDTAARTTKSWTTTSGVTGSTARAGTFTHYRTDNGLVDYTGKLNTAKTDADPTARTTTTFDTWASGECHQRSR